MHNLFLILSLSFSLFISSIIGGYDFGDEEKMSRIDQFIYLQVYTYEEGYKKAIEDVASGNGDCREQRVSEYRERLKNK